MRLVREAGSDVGGRVVQSPLLAELPHDHLLLSAVARAATPFVPGGRPKPWIVRAAIGELILSASSLSDMNPHDPVNRELLQSCGAALENLRIALHHRGRACAIQLFPDPSDLSQVASIRPTGPMTPHTEDRVLQSLLPPRAHPRNVHHRSGLLSPALLSVYRHAVRCTGAWLDIVMDDRRRTILGDIAADVERETVERVVASHAEGRAKGNRYGGSLDSLTFAQLLGSLGGRVRLPGDAGQSPAGTARERVIDSPLLCVLGTVGNGAADWIMAGRALQRLLLHAAAQSMSATLLSEPLERPVSREAVRSQLFIKGTPQAIVRLDFEEQDQGTAQPMASAVYH